MPGSHLHGVIYLGGKRVYSRFTEVSPVKRGFFVLISLLVVCSPSIAQRIAVRPIQDLSASFIMGVDVSMLDQLESAGAVFYDEKGKASDCLAILKTGGVNWIRLRIWNDPVNRQDVIEDGRLISRAGDPVGGGNDDLAAYIRIAKRAKKLGLKVLADFHYTTATSGPIRASRRCPSPGKTSVSTT